MLTYMRSIVRRYVFDTDKNVDQSKTKNKVGNHRPTQLSSHAHKEHNSKFSYTFKTPSSKLK